MESSNSLDKTGAGGEDGNHRLMVGDWIAEWDFTYGAWFYYNTKTEKSTWEQPPEMNHIKFKDPKTSEGNTILFRDRGKSQVEIHQFDLRNQIRATQTRISSGSTELPKVQVHSTVGKV